MSVQGNFLSRGTDGCGSQLDLTLIERMRIAFRGFAFSGSLCGLMVWVHTGLAREESVNHTFEYSATLSFLYSRLEKSIYNSCKFTDLGFQVTNVISLVLLFIGTSVFRGSEVGSARSWQDSFLCLLRFGRGLDRNHGGYNSCLRASMASVSVRGRLRGGWEAGTSSSESELPLFVGDLIGEIAGCLAVSHIGKNGSD